MLEKLIALLQDPHTHSLTDLAHALDTTPAMVETMLEDLERMGYVRQITACATDRCDTGHSPACKGCQMAGSCTPAGTARLWELIERRA